MSWALEKSPRGQQFWIWPFDFFKIENSILTPKQNTQKACFEIMRNFKKKKLKSIKKLFDMLFVDFVCT